MRVNLIDSFVPRQISEDAALCLSKPQPTPVEVEASDETDLVLIYRKPDDDTRELVHLGSHSELGL